MYVYINSKQNLFKSENRDNLKVIETKFLLVT